ncbi:MAG: PHP domain-containing protein [Nannocystales bacterium]
MKLDLHCHSTCSDGSLSAYDVARRAGEYGVELFSLTDHDTFAGFEDTKDVLEESGATVLRGMELSCKDNGRTVHLLLYDLQEGPGLEAVRTRTERIFVARTERLREICGRLEALGHHLDPEAILAQTHGVPGRPAVAKALVQAGICTSMKESFSRFLRDGGPADVPVERVSLRDGLDLGLGAGAKASLAHPHAFGAFALVESICRRHREHGLTGLEALYGRYGKAERTGWLRLVDKFDMVATGGSDFHGEAIPEITRPGIELDPARSELLSQWLLAG